MKVCFTSTGQAVTDEVDPRFGRARFFIIYDEESGECEAVDNQQNMNAASGAGVQSAMNVIELGCKVVVSGHIGPKAMGVLKEADIRVAVGAEGTVAEAIEQFKAGELADVDEADVAPRW